MKVALVSTGSGKVRRGFEVFFETLFRKLHGKMDITLLKGGGGNGVGEKRLPNLSRDSSLWKYMGIQNQYFWRRYRVEQYSFLPPLLYEIWKEKYDVLHLSEYYLARLLKILGKHFLPKVPLVVFHNGHPLSPEQYQFFDHIQQLTEYYYSLGIAAGVSPDKMSMVPIGVNEEIFSPRTDTVFRKKMNIREDSLLIMCVGALERRKRLDWLIEELSSLQKDVFLVIAGEQGERDEVQEIRSLADEKLRGSVALVRLEQRDMVEAYSATDLCISCALYEGFGIALIEAMAMELPVLYHHHPSLQWVVGEGGKAIDMAKKGELRDCILHFLRNRSVLKTIGILGRKRVIENFSWDILVPRYIQMYESMYRRGG